MEKPISPDDFGKVKADYVLYAKGNTHGGIKDNVHTIPIYGIGKYSF